MNLLRSHILQRTISSLIIGKPVFRIRNRCLGTQDRLPVLRRASPVLVQPYTDLSWLAAQGPGIPALVPEHPLSGNASIKLAAPL